MSSQPAKIMESADWRRYRGHLIIARRGRWLGGRRFEVWKEGGLLGSFRDVVSAELHVDGYFAPLPVKR